MAYDDALFQLGMDLTRSSTAQKEDPSVVARVKRSTTRVEDPKVFGSDRGRERSPGDHLTIDLHGALRIDDIGYVEHALRRSLAVAGAPSLHVHLHKVAPQGGIAGVVVFGDSHISVRSWPEAGYLALDVLCRGTDRLELSVDALKTAFKAREAVVKMLRRGEVRKPAGLGVREVKGAARVRRAA